MRHARPDYNRFQDPAGIIPADEPVFLLRGQDELAAEAVDYYAAKVEAAGGDPAVVKRSREWANEMRRWPVQKMPDLPKQQS